jgi:hypothetical protein
MNDGRRKWFLVGVGPNWLSNLLLCRDAQVLEVLLNELRNESEDTDVFLLDWFFDLLLFGIFTFSWFLSFLTFIFSGLGGKTLMLQVERCKEVLEVGGELLILLNFFISVVLGLDE